MPSGTLIEESALPRAVTRRRAAPSQLAVSWGRSGLQDKQVLEIRQHQFLVLLLVMEAELDQASLRPGSRAARAKQVRDAFIDVMRGRRGSFERRARQQPTFRPPVPRTDRLVVGVEEIAEPLIERPVARRVGPSTNCSKNQVVCARCHFAGLASGMLCTT